MLAKHADEWHTMEYIHNGRVHYKCNGKMRKMSVLDWMQKTQVSRKNGFWADETFEAFNKMLDDANQYPEGYAVFVHTDDKVELVGEVIAHALKGRMWVKHKTDRIVFTEMVDALTYVNETYASDEEEGTKIVCDGKVIAEVHNNNWLMA